MGVLRGFLAWDLSLTLGLLILLADQHVIGFLSCHGRRGILTSKRHLQVCEFEVQQISCIDPPSDPCCLILGTSHSCLSLRLRFAPLSVYSICAACLFILTKARPTISAFVTESDEDHLGLHKLAVLFNARDRDGRNLCQ